MKIIDLVRQNERNRKNSINMVVSENVLSERVKEALSIQHSRYHASFYGGTKVFQEIYNSTRDLAKEVFNCESVFLSPLSGNLAVIATLFAFSNPRDKIGILPLNPSGGYPINLEYFNRKRIDIPFDQRNFNIDLPKALEIFEKERPSLVFLGSSLFLFPHPVAEIAEIVHSYGGVVIYDGSHVLGLIAGNQFQDPLREGADILLGSTHKSFPGPQGGIILSNGDYREELDEVIGINPLEGIVLVDNIHNSRIAALGIALEEFQYFGRNYAKQIIKNSKALAHILDENQIPLHGKANDFTESHQVLMKISDYIEGAKYRDLLLKYRIITDAGMRFGTAELTRLGYKEVDIKGIGAIIAKVLASKSLSKTEIADLNNQVDLFIENAEI
ncbi:MAG: serine hydroxymethyltransferase [Candidatus Hodarchaeales archaeon]